MSVVKKIKDYINEEWYKPKNKTSVTDIAKRYFDKGDKAYNTGKTSIGRSYVIIATVKELDKYKEYTWSNKKFRRKDLEPEYWDKLVKDIQKNGIKEPLTIILYKNEKRAKIGEGNHRLGVAKELGIKELPVRFEWWMGDKPKPPEKKDKEFDRLLNKMVDRVVSDEEEAAVNRLLKQLGI